MKRNGDEQIEECRGHRRHPCERGRDLCHCPNTGFQVRQAAIGARSETPLAHSVFTAATAALSLAVLATDHKLQIREGGNPEATAEL
jgi:hypothetical protein